MFIRFFYTNKQVLREYSIYIIYIYYLFLLLLRPDGVIDPWLISFWQKTLSLYPPPAGLAPLREEEK